MDAWCTLFTPPRRAGAALPWRGGGVGLPGWRPARGLRARRWRERRSGDGTAAVFTPLMIMHSERLLTSAFPEQSHRFRSSPRRRVPDCMKGVPEGDGGACCGEFAFGFPLAVSAPGSGASAACWPPRSKKCF